MTPTISDDSGSDTTYSVTAAAAKNGKISLNSINAAPGAKVTITITPNSGYMLKGLSVADKNGKTVSTVKNADGTYSFTMPSSNVTITPAFTKTVMKPADTGVATLLQTEDHIKYINGYADGTVGPERSMTRGEVAQMFYNLLLSKNVTAAKSFADVPDTLWCAKAINTLSALGIINGYDDVNYGPNAPITREQFCAIAVRFASKIKTGSMSDAGSFSDVTKGSWSYDAIMTASSMGWINGYTNGAFGVKDSITRAQVITIVNHMLGRAANQKLCGNSHRHQSFP